MELQAQSPGGMKSPQSKDTNTTNTVVETEGNYNGQARHSYDDDLPRFVCGCIPHRLQGDFGCFCCKDRFFCKNIKYLVNPTVMFSAVIIIWTFVIWVAVDTDNASETIADAQYYVVKWFGWFYITALLIFGAFAVYLCFSKYGSIKLGPIDEPPKYSLMTWFSMLFSAGIGVGLYFFGVAEPVWHFADMQSGSSRWYHLTTNQQAVEAMNISWFHWGFTASACYCAAGLPLAFHHHVKNEPLRESICLMSLLGEKYANGLIGSLIDLTSVIGTMFGVATSLGLGVLSINAGLKFLFDVEETLESQMIIIWVITAFATISVLSGLDKGIRRLSEVNFAFSFIVLFFMFFVFDPIYLCNLFIQCCGYHIQWMFELTFNTQAMEQCGFYDEEDGGASAQSDWMQAWTVFYWAWWIAWAPFVGIFIAQISRGRTIREFIIGNMMVPTLLTCVWLCVFGGIGLYQELASIQNGITCDGDKEDWKSEYNGHTVIKLSCFGAAQDMLFATYETLPLSNFISVISLIGILTYFVTSSDSASHVIDVLTAGGNVEPPKLQRIFWAFSEGAVASVLLAAGHGESNALTALQTASLVAALPFTVVLLFEVMATYKTLLIYTGELKVEDFVFWKFDLFECGGGSCVEKCVRLVFGFFCPAYYQTVARLNIIKNNSTNRLDEGVNNSGYDPLHFYRAQYQDTWFKYVWVAGYWFCYGLAFLLACLAYFEGFGALACTFYLFYLIMSVGNRGLIKQYYQINSSHIIFDMCSWVFCHSCAAIQEVKQSEQGIELKVNAVVVNGTGNNKNNKLGVNGMEKAVSHSQNSMNGDLHSAPSAPVQLVEEEQKEDENANVNEEEQPMAYEDVEKEEVEMAPAAFEE